MFILSREDKENIQNNLFEYFKLFGKNEGGEILEGDEVTIVFTGTPVRFNRIFKTYLREVKADRKIRYIMDYFNDKNSKAIWLIRSGDRPVNLGRKLMNHGFGTYPDWIDMFINLNLEDIHLQMPDNFEIITVNSIDELTNWIETLCKGFGFEEDIDHYKKIFPKISENLDSNLKYYLGLYDNKPVSTCLSFFGYSVAGIQCISTIGDLRRKGFASAITKYAMNEANSNGYKIMFLQSEQKIKRIYENIGFKEYQRTKIYYI